MPASEWSLRQLGADDMGLLMSTWAEPSLRARMRSRLPLDPVPMKCIRAAYYDAIPQIIARPSAVALGIHVPGDERTLAGYAVGAKTERWGPVLHWVFVKSWYRRQGLAARLVNAVGISGGHYVHTHSTPTWRAVMTSKTWSAGVFDARAAVFDDTEEPNELHQANAIQHRAGRPGHA